MPNFFDQFDEAPAADATPRGVRNNNPLNIEAGPFTKSRPGFEGSDGRFAKFANPEDGFAAAEHLLGVYAEKHGIDTVAGVINRWAPASDNNPVSSYAGAVAKDIGVSPTDRIDLRNPSVRAKVADAMAKFENGKPVPRSTDMSAQARKTPTEGQNFFDQFDAQPSLAERSAVNEPPQNADAMRAGLVRLGAQRLQGEPASAAHNITMDFLNQGSAAGQRTTPSISAHQANLISADTFENDAGELLYRDPATGQVIPTDQSKQVALRDPADGKIKVFARTDETNEGVLSSLGRVVGTGLATGAPTARATVAVAPAVEAVQEARPGQQVIAAANRLSETGAPVQVPRAVATDNMPLQQVAAAASNVPVAGTPLVKAAESTISQLGTKADEVAKGFGGVSSPQEAGDTARSAIKNWITGESANTATKLYDRVDSLVDGSVRTPLEATRNAIADIAAKRSSAALPSGKATDSVLDAVQRSEGLTYEGVKTLRTNIGEMLKGGLLPEGMSGLELEKIYGALSKDLETSVRAAGGDKASAAFNRANQYYKLASERRASLAKIVGADGNAPAETVLNRVEAMAGSSSRADVSKLIQARKAIGSEDWNEIASTVVSRLGRDVEGNFTPQRFVTAYGKLSPAGKTILFRSGGKSDLAAHLDDIAKVSSRFKELQKFANPSGTARAGLGGLLGASAFAEPLTTLSSVLGGRVLATILARPASAASVAKWAKANESLALAPSPARLAALNTASRNLIATIGAKNLTPVDFLRALQGPVAGRAQDEQPKSERVIDR